MDRDLPTLLLFRYYFDKSWQHCLQSFNAYLVRYLEALAMHLFENFFGKTSFSQNILFAEIFAIFCIIDDLIWKRMIRPQFFPEGGRS